MSGGARGRSSPIAVSSNSGADEIRRPPHRRQGRCAGWSGRAAARDNRAITVLSRIKRGRVLLRLCYRRGFRSEGLESVIGRGELRCVHDCSRKDTALGAAGGKMGLWGRFHGAGSYGEGSEEFEDASERSPCQRRGGNDTRRDTPFRLSGTI
ncbi:hypothetical protein PYCCODRAFT_412751 [Trametes coccinea BRFM310]|uniref:Uncharacterized protein n=1 Tax=Trametes coccinea (strain BRFM310) TaxID=1353009 RepID=A0A1Y2IM91_TRAC3|nr:hypothetical protein PYCCODRAFT_412751 [Trametes coccinea BRFM310]